jgi:VanZ family protein
MVENSRLRRLWLWAPPVTYMAIVFYLSSDPDPLPALTERVWDKLLHFLEYGGLGVLLCRALVGERLDLTVAAVLAFVTTSIYGAGDEWHQTFTPGRSSDIHDWLADTFGGALGIAVYVLVVTMFFAWARSRTAREICEP